MGICLCHTTNKRVWNLNSKTVKSLPPLAEKVARLLFGIEYVPVAEQKKMVARAVRHVAKVEADGQYVNDGWISVDDRPDHSMRALVSDKPWRGMCNIHIARWDMKLGKFDIDLVVSHYQPLPTPPQEQEQ